MVVAGMSARLTKTLRAVSFAMLLGLGACSSLTPFDDWAQRYNTNVNNAQNNLLLTNVVRASAHMPLLFTGVQVVRGQGSFTGGISVAGAYNTTKQVQTGLGAVLGNGTGANPGAQLGVSDGFNFDVAVLDTAEFYKGLLTPLTPDAFNFYLSQEVPPEVLLNLLVQRITISQDGQTRDFDNAPGTPRYAAFQSLLGKMLELGLTTETASISVPIGPPLSPEEAGDVKSLVAAAQAGLLPHPVAGGKFQLVKQISAARFCFMAAKPGLVRLPQASLCKDSPMRTAEAKPATEDEEEYLDYENVHMTVTMRSTRAIFAYLGELSRLQTENGESPLELTTPEAKEIAPSGAGTALFRVIKGRPEGGALASADYRGATYAIPIHGQGVSATVMSMMIQLISLSKSVNSIPGTGTVVVAP
jgi:hypothetical protein